MCGIFGFVKMKGYSPKNNKNLGWFINNAIVTGTVRGVDGTGLFWGNKEGDVDHYKRNLTGYDFIQTKAGLNASMLALQSKFGVWHNRASTRGGNSSLACHPFEEGDITLVHNGTLKFYHSLTDKKKHDTVQNDSHAIAISINERGLEETIEMLDGAYTLIYHDKQDNSVNFIRNDQRPLSICYTKDNVMLFASERGMLDWLAVRNGFKIDNSFELDTLVNLKYMLENDQIKVSDKLKPYVSPYTKSNNNYNGVFHKSGKKVKLIPYRLNINKYRDALFYIDNINGDLAVAYNYNGSFRYDMEYEGYVTGGRSSIDGDYYTIVRNVKETGKRSSRSNIKKLEKKSRNPKETGGRVKCYFCDEIVSDTDVSYDTNDRPICEECIESFEEIGANDVTIPNTH